MSLRGGTPDSDTTRPNSAGRYKRFRAPRGDGQTLFDPPQEKLPELVGANRRLVADLKYDLLGTNLHELREQARRTLLADAGLTANLASQPLIVTGHQPELFHPGVWIKNFVAGALAHGSGGVGVNVVIDSDLCRSPSLRVPLGTVESPRSESVPFDAPQRAMPYEERAVIDAELFASFPDRVQQKMSGLLDQPLLLEELWPTATQIAASGGSLAEAIVGARHAVEKAWGNQTVELPISRVCDSAGFACFVVDILARLPDFQHAHNHALADYRAAHHLRSPAQPLPDLHRQDGWLEAPLWCWTSADPTRRPLYARQEGRVVELSNLSGEHWRIDLADAPVEQWADLRRRGVKIRSRALLTTLYLRLVLADVFIHGIGGAKYDEVTDHLAESFYGFAPPRYATVSATLRMPIEHPAVKDDDLRRIASELRELTFHPETRLADQPAAQPVIAEKRRWIATPKTPQNAAERHAAITAANQQMQPLVEPLRQDLLTEKQRAAEQLRAAAVLDSREYSFCLFPPAKLQELFRQVDSRGV